MTKAQDGGASNDQAAAKANIVRKMMPDSLVGKFYSKGPQTQKYIVIHNTAGGDADSNVSWFHSGQQPGTSIHFVCDDEKVYQLMELNWKAHHCGDKKDAAHASSPMTNSNTLGIEVADGYNPSTGKYDSSRVNLDKAAEVVIELTRYLMKELNIDADHVVRHHDVTGKQCPGGFMQDNNRLWNYIKEEIKKRNDENKPIDLNTDNMSVPSTSNNPGNSTDGGPSDGSATITDNGLTTGHNDYLKYYSTHTDYSNGTNAIDILPNQDHRYNIANMDEVRGACLIFLPPYNVCPVGDRQKFFEEWGWDRKYHYVIDHSYDVDANPDDDVPEINECTAGTSTDDSGTGDENSGTDEEGNTGDENGGSVEDGTGNDDNTLGDDDLTTATFFIKSSATFENTIFCGDSLTVGLELNNEKLRAFATGGHAIHQGYDAHMNDIKNASNVSNVVISYGVNDAGHQQPERFKKYYIKFINAIKESHPEAKIYVNKIFPGDLSRATNDIVKICLENVPSHNAVLPEVCITTGATLIDCTSFVNLNDYYSSDGIHFVGKFYTLWAEEMLRQISGQVSTNPNDPSNPGNNPESGPTFNTPEVNSPEATEDNCIVIKGGLEKIDNRLLQLYGLADVDKVTYISRSLFNGHPEKHNIMIACFIPSYDDLEKDQITYEKVEKNIINSVSKILWANGLEAKDLWREFDINRMPSPAIYLDRDKWKDLLAEIDKQVEWRNQKFGKVSTTYVPYVATISTIEFGSTPGGSTPSGGTPGEMTDVGEVEKTVYATLTGLGLTPEAACAIMGNMYQESKMDNDVVNSIGASGLCQWRLDRLDGLKKYAASKGKEWTDVATQAEWCWKECLGEDPTTKSKLAMELGSAEAFAKLTDIEKAVVLFRKCFERCGDDEARDDVRIKAAKDYYSKVAKGSASSGDDFTTASVNLSDAVFTIKSGTLSWPCPSCKSISSKYGPRNTGIPGASKNHKGIDIPCGSGSDIIAAAAGTVVVVKDGYNGGRGKYMVVDHGNGLGTLYQHLSGFVKSEGQSVAANEVIAKSGATGIGSGPHLHFEVHENFDGKTVNSTKNAVDPEKYVSPGTTNGSIPGSSSGGSTDPGSGDSGTGSTNNPTSTSSDKLVNSPSGDIVNPGPAAQLPYSGNSMGGLNHDDWGGKMIYVAGDPTDEAATKPEIASVLTSAEYKEFCDRFFMSEEFSSDGSFELKTSFRNYWEYIDIYVADHEPYDKGLVDADIADITDNDRLNALTTNFTTSNENTFHFNVVESGPGSTYHCVRAADELNVIARPNDLKVEPIYPDLIIPPHYSTTDYDESSPNTIPLSMLESTSLDEPDMNKQYAFDYNLLSGKKKETNPCSGPINFLDPYPIDDKIQELENHFPKVFIDEIESQMYSCNHPGCPIAQPMAKNFAMLQDAVMNQSKRVEQRLCKLENILSTIMRNQGRLASRININCVYYGGQSVYGKYKCIRCMHDDRIHDGAIVTLDQCLNCTRYEPILGQVYQILDDTGLNASIILDDMQMSYSDLYAVQQLNMGILRSPKYDYVEASGDKNCLKPEKTRIDMWKEANKSTYLEKKEATSNLEYEDEVENAAIEAEQAGVDAETATAEVVNTKSTATVKETDYLFRMDWNDTFFNQQEADVKTYPAENIIARYKKAEPDVDYETYLLELDPELDKDTIEDVQKEMSLLKGQWVDTREKAETAQVNKYSSENFYFKGFAEYKVANAVNGGSSPGSDNGGGTPGGAIGAECRAKIVEMAAQIVADHDAGKAKYKTPSPRTVDYTKPQSEGGKVCYDCTSFVSCCYTHAGLKSMYDKSCSGGSLIAEIVNNGGKMWMLNDAGLQEAKPGDVVLKANSAVSESQMGTKIGTSHAMIYIGDGKISHASSPQSGIKTEDLKSSFRWKDGKHFFVRPKDLIDADAQAAQTTPGGGLDETAGTIEGKNYVAKISGAVCTSYFSGSGSASGLGLENGKTCASHNIPYGTKIYFPSLKNKLGDGIVTVTDTGGPIFDFDIYTNAGIGKINADAYVLSWGTGKVSASYTEMIDFYNDAQWNNLKSAWNKYKSMNGQLINFLKFSQKDANVKNHKRY